MTTQTLGSIGDVERLNRSAGKHYFDEDTMRFFNSRIETDLIRGRFFITSEKGPDERRRFSIRCAFDSGAIETVGDFQQFASWEAADNALSVACAGAREVANDPYPDVEEPDHPERFNWRVVLGTLPVGPRTDKAAAEALLGELAGIGN